MIASAARRFDRWWYAPAPAERLAVLRILVGGFATVYLAVRARHFAAYAEYSAARFEPVGVVNILGEPLPGFAVEALVAAAILAGVAFTAGWRFRVSGPAFALLFLWVTSYGNSWAQIFHTENLIALHVVVLALAPSADACAVTPTTAAQPHEAYGWPVRLMLALTALTYVIGGVTKLENAGIGWATDGVLRNYVAFDNLRKAELGDPHSAFGVWLLPHGWLFTCLAFATLTLELGAVLLLLRGWASRLWIAGLWAFHAGILATMAILFPYQLLGFAYAPAFRVERLAAPVARLARRLAPQRRPAMGGGRA